MKEGQESQNQKGEVMTEGDREGRRRRRKRRRRRRRRRGGGGGRRRGRGRKRKRERERFIAESKLLALKVEEMSHESRNVGRF